MKQHNEKMDLLILALQRISAVMKSAGVNEVEEGFWGAGVM